MQESFHSFSATDLHGVTYNLEDLRGKIVMVVNTASKGQAAYDLDQLQKIQDSFDPSQLQVLAFPCRQFLKQESKNYEKICERYSKYTFPVFSLTKVNGPGAHPLFQWLKRQAPGPFGEMVDWNFTKFLVSPDGMHVIRILSTTSRSRVIQMIDELMTPAHDE